MTTYAVSKRELAEILDNLDRRALEQSDQTLSEDQWVNRRRSDRRPFRTQCTITFWDRLEQRPASLQGRTRNLSRLGLSVLAPREFKLGEPIEVSFSLAGSPALFMSGLVRFSRYAAQGYSEVGIAMQTAGDESILMQYEGTPEHIHAWLREAIENM